MLEAANDCSLGAIVAAEADAVPTALIRTNAKTAIAANPLSQVSVPFMAYSSTRYG